jgi:hypothetical protein
MILSYSLDFGNKTNAGNELEGCFAWAYSLEIRFRQKYLKK